MRNRIKYSQNFLVSSELVRNLIHKSGISPNDTVIEIGAGEGIITQELLKKSKKVVAFELDRDLFNKLSEKFRTERLLELRNEDFLNCNLPGYSYKVFSNIPFNITSSIIKKLTLENNPPEDSYLIVQKEAAMRFVGKPLDNKNSQLAIVLAPWFEFRFIHQFRPSDFSPRPNVDTVLLEIKKRKNPLVEDKDRYEDFVTFAFSQTKPSISEGLSKLFGNDFAPTMKPSELDFKNWLSLFRLFTHLPKEKQNIVRGSFAKQLEQQKNIEKINRTRVDKNWRSYRH